VSLPQLAGNLLSGPSSGTQRVATGQPTATRSTSKTTSPAPPPPTQPSLPLSAAGRGPQVPAGIRPTSVTFVNKGALGAVIGEADSPCDGPPPCTFVAGTRDYGGPWTMVGSPPAGPPGSPSGASQIRFLNRRDGFAYGPALWVTSDGGRSWGQQKLSGRVIDLATVSGRVFAVAASGCTGTGAQYAAGCSAFSLYSATASGGKWHQLAGGGGRVTPGGLQINASYGYLLAGRQIYAGPLGGAWRTVPISAASPDRPPCLTGPAGNGLIASTPTSSPTSGTLYLVCGAVAGQRSALYASGDGGRTWQANGNIRTPVGAAVTSLAASPAGPLVLATDVGIYYSSDARSWYPARVVGGVPSNGFGFVGMTTTSKGVAVPVNPALHEVFVTRDGGRIWRASPITR
jgi:photosystem II stability/assembly factor-like uncharacterized protein